MNRNVLSVTAGKRSYRLLFILCILILSSSVGVCLSMGGEAAIGCLLWSTAAALPITLFVSTLGSIFEDWHCGAALCENEMAKGRSESEKSASVLDKSAKFV